MNSDKIYIVIPCYNDKKMIRQTVMGLLPYGYSVVVVNDGSKQNIYEEVRDLPIIYSAHRINLGQGAALQTGMSIAMQRGAEIILHFDSDGQHSAADIPHMIKPILEDRSDV